MSRRLRRWFEPGTSKARVCVPTTGWWPIRVSSQLAGSSGASESPARDPYGAPQGGRARLDVRKLQPTLFRADNFPKKVEQEWSEVRWGTTFVMRAPSCRAGATPVRIIGIAIPLGAL